MNENKPMENQASVFDFSASQYDFFRKLITPRIMENAKKLDKQRTFRKG